MLVDVDFNTESRLGLGPKLEVQGDRKEAPLLRGPEAVEEIPTKVATEENPTKVAIKPPEEVLLMIPTTVNYKGDVYVKDKIMYNVKANSWTGYYRCIHWRGSACKAKLKETVYPGVFIIDENGHKAPKVVFEQKKEQAHSCYDRVTDGVLDITEKMAEKVEKMALSDLSLRPKEISRKIMNETLEEYKGKRLV